MVSAFFPPQGGVGVQRITKFVKYLRKYDWNPIVITSPVWGDKVIRDDMIGKDIPDDIEVYREFYFNYRKIVPGDIAKLFRPLERKHLYPDKYKIWNSFVIRRIKKLVTEKKIDAVFINMPPFSGYLLPEKIRRISDVPIVLTLRDPFSMNQYNILNGDQSVIDRAREIERNAYKYVDKVINVTEKHNEMYKAIFPEFSDKFSVITNGFDPDNFVSRTIPKSDTMNIAYTGSFSNLTPLKPLMELIHDLNENENTKIRLNIATNLDFAKVKKQHPECVKKGYVNFLGFLTHKKCIETMVNADLLAVTLKNSPATEFQVPGKLVEYINSGTEIFMLNNLTSDASMLVQRTKTGTVCNIDKPEEGRTKLLKLYTDWKSTGIKHEPVREEVDKYSYVNLTRQLAEVFMNLGRIK